MIKQLLALAHKIQEIVERVLPPDSRTFSMMLVRELSFEDIELMFQADRIYGEKRCNKWLVRVLAGTSHYAAKGETVHVVA